MLKTQTLVLQFVTSVNNAKVKRGKENKLSSWSATPLWTHLRRHHPAAHYFIMLCYYVLEHAEIIYVVLYHPSNNQLSTNVSLSYKYCSGCDPVWYKNRSKIPVPVRFGPVNRNFCVVPVRSGPVSKKPFRSFPNTNCLHYFIKFFGM